MKKYYDTNSMIILDENLEECGKFRYMNEVQGLQKVIDISDAGGKMLAKISKVEKLSEKYVLVVEGLTEEESISAAKALTPEKWNI